jgi:hypothetical protein
VPFISVLSRAAASFTHAPIATIPIAMMETKRSNLEIFFISIEPLLLAGIACDYRISSGLICERCESVRARILVCGVVAIGEPLASCERMTFTCKLRARVIRRVTGGAHQASGVE